MRALVLDWGSIERRHAADVPRSIDIQTHTRIFTTTSFHTHTAKPAPPKPLLDQPLVRAALAVVAAVVLLGGGFLYGTLHREEAEHHREQQRQKVAAARAQLNKAPTAASSASSSSSFEPSSRAIVEEEERSQGAPPKLFSLGDLAKVINYKRRSPYGLGVRWKRWMELA